MTTEAKKDIKPKTGKAPAAEKSASPAKVAAKKPAAPAKAPAEKKAAAPKKDVATGQVKVTQMIGSIARRGDQRATLIGLGLNKRHRSKVLEDTPSVRGMIYKVRHLIKVENVG